MFEIILGLLAILITMVVAGIIGFLIYDYCRHILPDHLLALVVRRLKHLYREDDEWAGIYEDWSQELLAKDSTISRIRETFSYLMDLRKIDVLPCVQRQGTISESDGPESK